MGLGYTDIIEKAEDKINAVLPAYKKIFKVFNPEAESKRILDKGYGILYGSLAEETGATATRHLTTRGDLVIILTNNINLRNDNQDLVIDLYNDVETLIRGFKDGSRLGSSVVLDIGAYNISAPILLDGTEHMRVEITFNVLFRELL